MEISTLITFLETSYHSYGFVIVFFASLIETTPMGWMIPGGIMAALGGFFAFGNTNEFVVIILSGTLGMITTLLGGYYLGHKTGLRLAKKLRQEKNAKRAEKLLEKNGAMILTTSMLANLTRFWIAYVAGIHKYNLKKFTVYATAASLTWSSLLVTVGYLAGSEKDELESGLAKIGILAWVLVFLALGTLIWNIKKEKENLEEEK